MAKKPDWLREHMRDHIAGAAGVGATEDVLNFQRDFRHSATTQCDAALDLVHQVCELIRDIQDRASETEAYAQNLVTRAAEKLQQSERRAESAEIGRREAEEDTKQVKVRLEELEESLARAESIIVTAEQRADAAETRANETEKALRRVEDAIRTQLLGATQKGSRNMTRAA
jgi:chromosome segregation ATPase